METSDIEAVHELSPLQQGMLFEHALDPTSGFYLEQLRATLVGELDVEIFRAAWQATVDRHTALRSSFHWRDLERPLQVVHHAMPVVLDERDWREVPEEEAAGRFDQLLAEDRARGFDLAVPPAMRWCLVRLAERTWRLVWTFHHVAFDGWSIQIILSEVFGRYDAARRGEAYQAAPAMPFGDYVEWVQRQDAAAAREFWAGALAGFARPTPLGDGPVAPGAASALDLETHRMALPEAATAALLARAREWKVTPTTLVQAAWALLLGRSSGERDVLFGLAVSGRPAELADVESAVGAFLNTLPLRLPIDEDAPIAAWLADVQTRQLAIRQFEHSALVEVQQGSDVPRGAPLFESLVIFQNAPSGGVGGASFGGLELRDVRLANLVPLALTLESWIDAGRWVLSLSCDRRRFPAATAGRILRRAAALLGGMSTTGSTRVADLPLMDDDERREVVEAWGRGAAAPPTDTFPALFAAQAARTPSAPAVSDGIVALTYGELDRRSNRLARHLARIGVRGRLVGVFLRRSTDLVVACVAALKAGAVYLPLDPGYPVARLHQVLGDSGVGVVVTDAVAAAGLEGATARLLALDTERAAIEAEPDSALELDVDPGDLAYVIYTSGSTGRPKGAMLVHRGLANHLANKVALLDLGPGEAVAQTASQSFDISVWQLLAGLTAGARVEVFPDEVAFDATRLLAAVEERGVTVLETVPSLLRAVLDHLERPSTARSPLGRLRWLLCIGDALPPDLCRRWLRSYPHVPLRNEYGPTECTDNVTHDPVPAPPADDEVRVPIGRPLANVRAYLLDPRGRPVPPGVAGELLVGGAGVGRGYLGQPAMTAAAFVPDPFGGSPGARLYRTGDQARWREDGRMEFLGRRDHQVKIRGHRIELEEVRAALSARAGLADCAVVARATTSGDARLVAYLATGAGPVPSIATLRAELAQAVPESMIPSAFVFLEALPLTPNGKLDRAALPEPEGGRVDPGTPYQAPSSPTEHRLAGLWCEVLGRDRVGIDDNFFELGGHSLLAMRLLAQLNEVFGTALPLRDVVSRPTVAAQAARIVDAQLAAMSDDETASLMAELQDLPEDALDALLRAETAAPESEEAR